MAISRNWAQSPIVARHQTADNHVELILKSPELATAVPGQFAHVLTPGMLRRPISFSRIDEHHGEVGLLFQVVGSGTKWLSQRLVGDVLDILGPLGHGFPPPDPHKPWVLVGGGVGVPPLYCAAQVWLKDVAQQPSAIIGARTAKWLLMADDFATLGIPVALSTDDGSAGRAGTIIEPLEEWLGTHGDAQVYACGPMPMLQAVSHITKGKAISFLALEQRMGCGIGACLACVVPTQGNLGIAYRRVCTEGPVFRAEELMW